MVTFVGVGTEVTSDKVGIPAKTFAPNKTRKAIVMIENTVFFPTFFSPRICADFFFRKFFLAIEQTANNYLIIISLLCFLNTFPFSAQQKPFFIRVFFCIFRNNAFRLQ